MNEKSIRTTRIVQTEKPCMYHILLSITVKLHFGQSLKSLDNIILFNEVLCGIAHDNNERI